MDLSNFDSVEHLLTTSKINKGFESSVMGGGGDQTGTKILSLISIDVSWSLYPNRFITFGNDMKLYQTDPVVDTPQLFGGCQQCEVKIAASIQSKDDIRNVRALAWNNRLIANDRDVLYALGYPNGRVVLSHFYTEPSSINITSREFSPRVPRACNSLDFSQLENNLLVGGFDRPAMKGEHGGMVWDLNHSPGNPVAPMGHVESGGPGNAYAMPGLNRPVYEFGAHDQVTCVKWHTNERNYLFACHNNKQIKIWDLRTMPKDSRIIGARGVHGICIDPFSDIRLVSFIDNNISLWDMRKTDGPAATLKEASSIVKIEYCPTRSNLVGVLLKDSSIIKLYDYKDFKNISEDPEPTLICRDITPFEATNQQIISSFSWHPTNELQMSTITTSGVLKHFKALDRITLNWSPTSDCIWTHGNKIFQSRDCLQHEADQQQHDVAISMRKLAQDGYGLTPDKLWQMFRPNTDIYCAWKWLALRIVPLLDEPGTKTQQQQQGESPRPSANSGHDLFGQHCPERLHGIIRALFNKKRTQLAKLSDLVSPFSRYFGHRKVYTSVSRTKVLQHCGWSCSRSRFISSQMLEDMGLGNMDINAVSTNESDTGEMGRMFNESEEGEVDAETEGETEVEGDGLAKSPTSEPIVASSTPEGTFDQHMPCDRLVESCKAEGLYTRLAAIYVFNGQLPEAIKVLNIASNIEEEAGNNQESISLNSISLALCAYTNASDEIERRFAGGADTAASDNTNIWYEQCAKKKDKYKDPYIRAILGFLSMSTFDDESYNEIINDLTLDIADRVAMAAIFLSDSALAHNLLHLKEQLMEKGELSALLLTGISEEGLELFLKYLERTSDVQTVSLLLLWALPCKTSQIPLARTWTESYRSLLDCWRLWNVRAKFDIRWYAGINYDEEPDQKIYAACNVCAHPLSAYISVDDETYQAMVAQSSQATSSVPPAHQYRITQQSNSNNNAKYRQLSCSNCYKSLPRCSLCLMQMGTMAGTYWRPGHGFTKPEHKLTPFSSWFTWCQTCRHGGHAFHLIAWFNENSECPVADCQCNCMALDPQAHVLTKGRGPNKLSTGMGAADFSQQQQ